MIRDMRKMWFEICKIGIFIFIGSIALQSNAAILWIGSEDLDFPNGVTSGCNAGGTATRAGYARASVYACGGTIVSTNAFVGGAITSGWLSARMYINSSATSQHLFGLGKLGNNNSLWVGNDTATNTKAALWKYDGTTWTKLASEAGTSLFNFSTQKMDMQVISYGASATVNIYANGTASPILTYSGDVTAGGNASLNTVTLLAGIFSEIIVSDSDTRNMSLVTLAPNAAGTAGSGWVGTYASINPTTINDAANISDATSGDIFQTKMNALPAGNFSVLGARVATRGIKTATGPGSLSVGVYTNAASNIPAASALQTTWGNTYETLYQTNPVTAANWTTGEINVLQLLLQSAP